VPVRALKGYWIRICKWSKKKYSSKHEEEVSKLKEILKEL
jgi:hypothetical protein